MRHKSLHCLCRVVGILHVGIAVAIVAHEHESVAPSAWLIVCSVAHYLIHKHLCLSSRSCRQPAHSHVGFAGVLCAYAELLTIVEHGVKVVGNIAFHCACGILALKAEEEVVAILALPFRRKHAVVPSSVAKEQ